MEQMQRWEVTYRIVKTGEVVSVTVTEGSANAAAQFIRQDCAARIDSDLAEGIEILDVIEA